MIDPNTMSDILSGPPGDPARLLVEKMIAEDRLKELGAKLEAAIDTIQPLARLMKQSIATVTMNGRQPIYIYKCEPAVEAWIAHPEPMPMTATVKTIARYPSRIAVTLNMAPGVSLDRGMIKATVAATLLLQLDKITDLLIASVRKNAP